MDRFDGKCPGHNAPVAMETRWQQNGSKLYLNYTFTVKEDVPDHPLYVSLSSRICPSYCVKLFQLTINLERCKSKENLDTCEQFNQLKHKYCETLSSTNSVWGKCYSKVTPPWKCPLKKVGKFLNNADNKCLLREIIHENRRVGQMHLLVNQR